MDSIQVEKPVDEIDELTNNVSLIEDCLERLLKVKEETVSKLEKLKKEKDEENRVNFIEPIDRTTSKTLCLLTVLEEIYCKFFSLHGNKELFERSKTVLEEYGTDFRHLEGLYETLTQKQSCNQKHVRVCISE
ncbi:hypothetical protein LSTR_LSTR010382 [Laodelphax striatellus]|uniref:Uncharacterized protein n=1 Tax=Laodelphax striatellus TaxID=195883 RepID=A0A482XIS7_LAOST|nr:hypothetical protein LSTR_LSTR010382 [Laodelphax striatellus]